MARASSRGHGFKEDGNILLLGLGVACVALLTLLGTIQVGSWYLAKKELSNVADTAALIYADQAAANSYYARIEQTLGLSGPVRESPQLKSTQYVNQFALANEFDVEVSFHPRGTDTELTVTRPAKAQFLIGLGKLMDRHFVVSVSATAISVNPE